MKKNLARKIMLSILTGAVLFSTSSVWAETNVDVKDSIGTSPWTGIVVNSYSGTPSSAYADGDGSIAIGDHAGVYSSAGDGIAVGRDTRANTENSIALGSSAKVLGNAENGVALGCNAQVESSGKNSVALGFDSIATEENVVSVGNGGSTVLGGPATRKIVNVTAGENATDAVNVGQMNDALALKANAADVYTKSEADNKFAEKATTLAGYGIGDAYTKGEVDGALASKADKDSVYTKTEADGLLDTKANKNDVYTKAEVDSKIDGGSAAVAGLNQRLEKTNAKINKVGAGAAALAALHPLDYDPDDKLTFSAGMGNYAGENAAALGAFYRPNEKFMLSLGGTMGNGENMVNLGLSIGLDKPNGFAKMSKRELIQEVNAVKAENEAMKAEMAEMKAMLQELLAKK